MMPNSDGFSNLHAKRPLRNSSRDTLRVNRPITQPIAIYQPKQRAGTPARVARQSRNLGLIALYLAHIPLAIFMYRMGVIATAHAMVTLAVGVGYALSPSRRSERVAYVGAYIAGAEVLWRMTNAQVFWEFGKYATVTIFLITMLRTGRLKGPALMLGYFALLLPSIAVILVRVDPSEARGYVSFNLSGPLAMTVAACFFSQLKMSPEQVQRLFLVAIGPIIGIASVTFLGIRTVNQIAFTGESNVASSGGFGPNQVSAALGLGALFALMFILLGKSGNTTRLLVFGGLVFMSVQSAMTFSRGGLYDFAGAVALASIYMLRDARMRRRFLFVGIVIFVLGSYVIIPQLEDFTGGALGSRFRDTETTNRIPILQRELRVWEEHPLLGVGPGGGKLAGASMAHTEFARMPAEHGLLGIAAFFLLVTAAVKTIARAQSMKAKAFSISMIGWSFLFMLNTGMRLLAPAFAFGLAFATILPDPDVSRTIIRERPPQAIPRRAPPAIVER